jgi:hypothetical protein
VEERVRERRAFKKDTSSPQPSPPQKAWRRGNALRNKISSKRT